MNARELDIKIRRDLSKLGEMYRDLQADCSSLRSLYGLLAEKALKAGVTSAPLQGTGLDETALRIGLLVTQHWYGLDDETTHAICEALVKAGASKTDMLPEWFAPAGTDKGALVKEDENVEPS